MNRKELTRRAADLLRLNDVRKPVSIPKQVLHISDDEGNQRDFSVRKADKKVLFTIEDVEAILDALLNVTHDAIRHGEQVTIRGFGTLCLRYRKGRELKHVSTGEDTIQEARYSPKFVCGKDLKFSAKRYELSLGDLNDPLPIFEDEDTIEDGDE